MFGTADSELQDRLTGALAAVMALRARLASDQQLSARWRAVKQFQAERLRATYLDLLAMPRYREPCEFFLEELYGARDFDQRDAEAQRVVPKLAKMLPARAVETLLLAVQLDEMSERFDSELARTIVGPVTAVSWGQRGCPSTAPFPLWEIRAESCDSDRTGVTQRSGRDLVPSPAPLRQTKTGRARRRRWCVPRHTAARVFRAKSVRSPRPSA